MPRATNNELLSKKYDLGKSDIIEHNDTDDSFSNFHNVISEVTDHFINLRTFRNLKSSIFFF